MRLVCVGEVRAWCWRGRVWETGMWQRCGVGGRSEQGVAEPEEWAVGRVASSVHRDMTG